MHTTCVNLGLSFRLSLTCCSAALLAAHIAGAQDNANPQVQPKGGKAPTLAEVFSLLDKDGDGQITKAEATGQYAQRFLQWDVNKDGIATREEIQSFRRTAGLDDNSQRLAAGGKRGAAGPARANVATEPTLLKQPADWRWEALPVPPGFAADVKLKGTEEARFAPGMYDTNSTAYFSYILAIAADGATDLGAEELKDFLEKYFRGLSVGVGRSKGLTPDPAQMEAVVTPSGAAGAKKAFNAEVTFFDTFTDGRKITLHVEAEILPRAAAGKTYMILLLSPSAKDAAIWLTLREAGKTAITALP